MSEDKRTEDAHKRLAKHRDSLPPVDPDQVHIYFKSEVKFLDIYAETLDYKLACREANLKPHEVRRNTYLMKELKKVQRMVQKRHLMKAIKGKHMQLLEKFDEQYDALTKNPDTQKEAVTMAGNLARMTDSAMRANGEFRDIEHAIGKQVNVTINLGPDHTVKTGEDGNTIDIETR